MNLPRGYRTPETIYEVVRVDEETDSVAHGLGAFDSELEAQRLIDELETEGGYGKLAVNRIPVHARLSDWQFDR
jgi:hypothetical protein